MVEIRGCLNRKWNWELNWCRAKVGKFWKSIFKVALSVNDLGHLKVSNNEKMKGPSFKTWVMAEGQEKPCICQKFDKAFTHNFSLKQHARIHIGENRRCMTESTQMRGHSSAQYVTRHFTEETVWKRDHLFFHYLYA